MSQDLSISEYFDLPTEEIFPKVALFLQTHSVQEFIRNLEQGLESANDESVAQTLTLLRDLLIIPFEPDSAKVVSRFLRKEIPGSRIFELLEKRLYSENEYLAASTVYTIGKIGYGEMAEVLKKSIPFFETQHPNALIDVISEYFWLVKSTNYEAARDLVANHSLSVALAVKKYYTEIFMLDSMDKEDREKIETLLQEISLKKNS